MDAEKGIGEPQYLAQARVIAEIAHTGQMDKIGVPYIRHPERVAARAEASDHEGQAAAWLHDVLEDSDFTPKSLRLAGIPEQIVQAVEALTHREHEPLIEYWERVRSNVLALRVKGWDIQDNTDPERMSKLDVDTQMRLQAKYARAMVALGIPEGKGKHRE